MKHTSAIGAIVAKWTGKDYGLDDKTTSVLVNNDIAILLAEIERLTKENEALKRTVEGKTAGVDASKHMGY